MASSAIHPAVLDAQELSIELRDIRRAALSDCRLLCGEEVTHQLEAYLAANETLPVLPTAVRAHLDALDSAQKKLDELRITHGEILDQALDARATVLRHAVELRQAELSDRARQRDAELIVELAAAGGRALTRGEAATHFTLIHEPSAFDAAAQALPSTINTADVFQAFATQRLREAKQQLDSGLLLTRQMRLIRGESTAALRRGEPLLLIGETGGAKTALAEHLSSLIAQGDPEFVSGFGDITSAQVIGAHELRAHQGATLTEFVPGPLLRAMIEGRPIILDEINAMPAEFLKRLNRILQLRPDDMFSVQENAGARVRIRQGFGIIATANEQSARRYRGIEQMSAELVNRFGANTFRVHYPDAQVGFTDIPPENLLLASAAAADRDGRIMRGITAEELERIAKAAFISQRVFTGSHDDGFSQYVSTERAVDGRPGLDETVLAPRTMVALVTKVSRSAGAVSLDHAANRFVDGIMNREDREVITMILRGQGFSLRP